MSVQSAEGIALLAGLGAAVALGTGDFCLQKATRDRGWWISSVGVSALSLLVLGLWSAFNGWADLGKVSLEWLAGGAVAFALGSIGLARAFEEGAMATVAPVIAGYAGVSVVLAWLSGQPLEWGSAFGLGLLFLGGVVVVSSPDDRDPSSESGSPRALVWALLCVLGLGVAFYALEFLSASGSGSALRISTLAVFRGTALMVLMGLAQWRTRPEQTSDARAGGARWIVVAALCDTLGLALYALGSGRGAAAFVAVPASLFCAVSVGLAAWSEKRAPRPRQRIGLILVVLALMGIALGVTES